MACDIRLLGALVLSPYRAKLKPPLEVVVMTFDTVDSLAEKLHVSKGLISQWENKKAPIPNKRLEELSKLYNTPKEYFFKELNRLDKLRLQENKIVDVLSKTDEVDENDTIINTINTFSNCLDVPKMELLKNTQTIIEFEELIQKIYDISEINCNRQILRDCTYLKIRGKISLNSTKEQVRIIK